MAVTFNAKVKPIRDNERPAPMDKSINGAVNDMSIVIVVSTPISTALEFIIFSRPRRLPAKPSTIAMIIGDRTNDCIVSPAVFFLFDVPRITVTTINQINSSWHRSTIAIYESEDTQ